MPVEELTARVEAFYGREGLGPAVEISWEKIGTLADFWPLAGFIYEGPKDDPIAREKWLDETGRGHLEAVRDALAGLDAFGLGEVEEALRRLLEERGAKAKQVFQPIRVALAGSTISPGIFETLAVLGRDESLARIDAALAGTFG
jgi:glutamyl-tRNA synthetase